MKYPDDDEVGIISSILTCLHRLPSDVRSLVMENIMIIGGGASIPGLRTRISTGLKRRWQAQSLKISTTPINSPPGTPTKELTLEDLASRKEIRVIKANALEATFIGASVLGDIKVKGFGEVSRESFNLCQGRNVMDWTFVGGTGDDSVEESKRRSRG